MVKLALLWHMHQPYYEDLATGEHILPWVRLHATKDYWGMVALLREFPGVRATFNLVPSLLVQVEAFAADRAVDPHLAIGLKPAHLLSEAERRFLVANGFHAPVAQVIQPRPRYAELYDRRLRPEDFSVDDLRDLQVLHKLVWMDPDKVASDPRLQRLEARGRQFSEDDKQTLRTIELELLAAVVPAYRDAAAAGQIELATSPFYHPILPLLCDSDTHFRAQPHSALPRRLFAHPDDARAQIARAWEYHAATFGTPPRGMWPSEGSVSDQVIALLAAQGCEWTATDEEILARSLGRRLTAADLYRPYRAGEATPVRVLFRDHELSDLIGFAYQSWDPEDAAADFVQRVRAAGARFAAETGGEEATIAVILDGENAWEYYAGGGRPFLRAFYRRLEEAADIDTVTMSAAASGTTERPLPGIFPGSWINGDFYIWAGHADDHRAWAQLAAARSAYERVRDQVSDEQRQRAYTELLIAEGSDWFWWYGDDHSSDHDREFDDLFRRHVRNVYRALSLPEPDELHVSNITTGVSATGIVRFGHPMTPALDGQRADVSWIGAPEIALAGAGGAMHRVTSQLIDKLWAMADLQSLYLRLDGNVIPPLADGSLRLEVLVHEPQPRRLQPRRAARVSGTPDGSAVLILGDALDLVLPWDQLGATTGGIVTLAIQLSDANGRAVERQPGSGPLAVEVPSARHLAAGWLV